MAKVIMICGKICSGKSTYSEKLRKENKAVVLSVDEITLALFEQSVGEKHDEYVAKLEKYLFEKSLDIVSVGVDVILDWGFWTKEERDFAREFYSSRDIRYEFHYIDVSDETWGRRLNKRNKEILAGEVEAYYVDANLKEKVESIFECPDKNKIDVWIES